MKTLIIFLIGMKSFTCLAQFDKINWGMSKDQVIRLDSLKDPVIKEGIVLSKEVLGSLLIEKIYSFDNDKFSALSILYSKTDKKANTETYALKVFNEESKLFSNLIGKPYKVMLDGPVLRAWKTPTHKLIIEVVYDEEFGFAVKREYLIPDLEYEGIDY